MKVLIGTPIHKIKDYAMERWLDNVAKLQKAHPADLLLVDNSPGLDYVEKVRGYCEKYGVQNYKIEHLELGQGVSLDDKDRRIEKCQELIRQNVLSGDYDAWFSWESDQLLPTDALDKLVNLMIAGGFMLVVHNCWARNNPNEFNPDMGCTLIGRVGLERQGFLRAEDLIWNGAEAWFKERVLRAGGNYVDVYGLINPIYHLGE